MQIVLEMANNHQGSVQRGIDIIDAFCNVTKKWTDTFDFLIKFQMRNMDTFLHKTAKDNPTKYTKRFIQTSLKIDDFARLKQYAEERGFKTLCTPFDELSVLEMHTIGFDKVKIASCSCADYPLINKITQVYDKSTMIVISTAGATTDQIDSIISYFANRKYNNITVMHCVGDYPTDTNNLQLSKLDVLQKYPNIKVGLSTHEKPCTLITAPIIVGKNITMLEKHIDLGDLKQNTYSVTPNELDTYLLALSASMEACKIRPNDESNKDMVKFIRGAYLRHNVKKHAIITRDDLYFAFPNHGRSQVLVDTCSKYTSFTTNETINEDDPLMIDSVVIQSDKSMILNIVKKIKQFIKQTNITIPETCSLELSHHYGLNRYFEYGSAMFTIINEKYCKKIIVMLPGQKHPTQYHKTKHETFILLAGHIDITRNNNTFSPKLGDSLNIGPWDKHSFKTDTGAIIEEISTRHYKNDSFYIDDSINFNVNRKTTIKYWSQIKE